MRKVLFLLVLFSIPLFAQDDISSPAGCYNTCVGYCLCSGNLECMHYCAAGCAEGCGFTPAGGIGITNPEPCTGVTTPDGYPTVYSGAGCVDPQAWEHYCTRAVTCNSCNNLPAYSCIWTTVGCVPCKGSTCIKSCGGGGGYTTGGGGQTQTGAGTGANGNAGDGTTGPEADPCGAYPTCDICTTAAQAGDPNLENCAWFPVEKICHDKRIEATGIIETPGQCGSGSGSAAGVNAQETPISGSSPGATDVCIPAFLLPGILGAILGFRVFHSKSASE